MRDTEEFDLNQKASTDNYEVVFDYFYNKYGLELKVQGGGSGTTDYFMDVKTKDYLYVSIPYPDRKYTYCDISHDETNIVGMCQNVKDVIGLIELIIKSVGIEEIKG